jgi:hypothetical protein
MPEMSQTLFKMVPLEPMEPRLRSRSPAQLPSGSFIFVREV